MKPKGLLGRADYSFGPGTSPVAGAALSALTTAAVTAPVFEFSHISPTWGLVGGAATAAASIGAVGLSKTVRLHQGRAMCYRAACWLGAGLWSWWQLSHHPWSWNGMAALGIGAGVAAVAGLALEHAEDKAISADMDRAAAELTVQQAARQDRIAQVWQPLIEKVTRIVVRIAAVKLWDDGTGYTIEAELPLDGTTIGDLKPFEEALATAAGLKPGCNVMISRPDVADDVPRNVVWLRVNTVNAMAQDLPLPEDWAPRTIENPVPFGEVTDGSVGGVSLRERCMVLAGESGSGKSTALNVAIKGVGQCVDVFPVMVDTKGGGEAARRWVRAWYEGRADRPVLGLVANTDELARLLLLGLCNIVDGRPVQYAELMHQQNADKIMPARELPQIVLIVDEFKSLPDDVKDLVEYIADKGRSAGVRMILSTLDPTAAGIPSVIIKQCRERYGLRVSDEATLHHLFDRGGKWTSRFDPSSMTHAGMGLLSTNAQIPIQIKGWKLEPADIDAISIRLAGYRADLDGASIDMFETVTIPGRYGEDDQVITGLWSKFWEMTLEAMFPKGGSASAPNPPTASGPAAPDMKAGLAAVSTAMSGLDEAGKRLEAALAEADSGQDGAGAEDGDPEHPQPVDDRPASSPDPEFDAIVRNGEPVTARERYRQWLRELGPTGATEISSRMRREGYSTSRQTVQDWFAKDETAGHALRTEQGWIWTGPTP